jgi:methyl-accepting chemotaxis protein
LSKLGGGLAVLFNKLKIKTRLNILIALISLLLIGIGITGLSGINASNNALSTVYNDHLTAIEQLNEIRNVQMQIRISLLGARQETDAFEILNHVDQVRGHIFRIETLIKTYKTRQLANEEKALLEAFIQARENFGMNGVMPMIDLLQAEDFKAADKLRKETMDPAYHKASGAIDTLLKYQVERAKAEYERSAANVQRTRTLSIASIAIGLALSITIGLLVIRAITHGVSQLETFASHLAQGDLSRRIALDSKDEIGEVSRVFNRMADDFSSLISQVRNASDEVAQAASSLSESASKIMQGSHSQSEQASITAASVESLNRAIKEVDQRTQEVASAASEASRSATCGQEVVNNAASEIQKIAETVNESADLIDGLGQRSSEIGQIVNVIREIAEQTNLLALNAAIEAARAGEQGRGFAVVADEVRKLAERTATATTQIAQMIETIRSETANAVQTMKRGETQVGTGVELAKQAGQSLSQINHSIHSVVAMIQQIAEATHGESTSSEEITTRVEHISQMARENSGSTEDTAQAIQGLLQLSAQLQQAVSHLKS